MLKHCKACLEYMHTDKPAKDSFCDYQCYSMYLEDENKMLKKRWEALKDFTFHMPLNNDNILKEIVRETLRLEKEGE